MDSFNNYKFADVDDNQKQMINQLEQSISKEKDIVLIAYENKEKAEG